MSSIPAARGAAGARSEAGLRRFRMVTGTGILFLSMIVVACSTSDTSTGSVDDDRAPTSSTEAADDASTTTTAFDPAAVAAQPSEGCAAASGATAGSTTTGSTTTTAEAPDERGQVEVTTESGGIERWYLRHVPGSYQSGAPMPLVVDIHGYSEGAQIHSLTSSLAELGDSAGFITVTPQGQGSPAHWETQLDSPDVAYIGQVMDEVSAEFCVDLARIYVAGFSNGAFLTSAVACGLSGRVAAVAPVAGMRDLPGCDLQRPVPAIAFHGNADKFVSFEGGLGPAAAALPAFDGSGRTLGQVRDQEGPSDDPVAAAAEGDPDETVPEIAQAWAARNGCAAPNAATDDGVDDETIDATETQVADDVTLLSFDCPADAQVLLYEVLNGGHAWPGSEFSRSIESIVGHTTFNIDANALMWQFFTQHPLAPG